MILLLAGVALADPDVVRVPTAGIGASVGSAGVSGVGWFGDQGIGAAVGGSISLFGAARTPVRSGWGAGLTFGVAVPLAAPTLTLETSAWIGPAWHGRWLDLGVDLVVPAAAAPFDGAARIGARVEPRVGVHLRGVTVSVSGGAGVVESTDSGWAMDLRAAVGIALPACADGIQNPAVQAGDPRAADGRRPRATQVANPAGWPATELGRP